PAAGRPLAVPPLPGREPLDPPPGQRPRPVRDGARGPGPPRRRQALGAASAAVVPTPHPSHRTNPHPWGDPPPPPGGGHPRTPRPGVVAAPAATAIIAALNFGCLDYSRSPPAGDGEGERKHASGGALHPGGVRTRAGSHTVLGMEGTYGVREFVADARRIMEV